jgi:hypothetical protein
MTEKEDLALEVLVDFLNAVEAAAVGAKHRLKEAKVPEVAGFTWNPDKIKWVEAEGAHGKYEKSEDVNSLDFKELMKDLEVHNGKLTRKETDGACFYWKFEKSAVIGRKKRS